jgi:ParB/RepB/Spo0J family partition protein
METLAKMKMTEEPIDSLKPNPNNPRTHSPRQIRQLARSIRKFGFNEPVITDKESNIIVGHGRVLGAKQAGLTRVPVIRKEDLTPADIRAYMIAANQLAQNAGWDRKMLAVELQSLIELDFDVSITGFEMAQVDVLLAASEEK